MQKPEQKLEEPKLYTIFSSSVICNFLTSSHVAAPTSLMPTDGSLWSKESTLWGYWSGRSHSCDRNAAGSERPWRQLPNHSLRCKPYHYQWKQWWFERFRLSGCFLYPWILFVKQIGYRGILGLARVSLKSLIKGANLKSESLCSFSLFFY